MRQVANERTLIVPVCWESNLICGFRPPNIIKLNLNKNIQNCYVYDVRARFARASFARGTRAEAASSERAEDGSLSMLQNSHEQIVYGLSSENIWRLTKTYNTCTQV